MCNKEAQHCYLNNWGQGSGELVRGLTALQEAGGLNEIFHLSVNATV